MTDVLLWLFDLLADLVQSVLNWHIIEDLSILHILLGFFLLSILLSFLSFGVINAGSTVDGFSARLRARNNEENRLEREIYKNSYEYYKQNRDRQVKYSKKYEEESSS